MTEGGQDDEVVVRKGEHGWVVGDENVSDLTSAMVLADLFAADRDQAAGGTSDVEAADRRDAGRPVQAPPSVRSVRPRGPGDRSGAETDEADRLAVTVSQLEHALASRVRVEQAIGVLAERHRTPPRDAFDLLRRAARARGQRVIDIAQDVVASASNPLVRLPEELARTAPEPRGRSVRRSPRHARSA